MGRVAVVTDSTADFPSACPADLNLAVVPLTIHWGKEILRDGIDITARELYTRLQYDPNFPRTAAPPIGIFEELYERLLRAHDAVISIHISGRLSGTAGVASTAAHNVAPERIRVLNSMTTSVGLGWLVERAAELAAGGAVLDAIEREVQGLIPRLRLFMTLETLDYLYRGGRIRRAQAFVGGLLNVKPILQLRDGEVLPLERVRTRAASIRRLAEIAGDIRGARAAAIVHGDAPEDALALRELLVGDSTTVPLVETGAILATHTGPGLLGVGWIVDG